MTSILETQKNRENSFRPKDELELDEKNRYTRNVEAGFVMKYIRHILAAHFPNRLSPKTKK